MMKTRTQIAYLPLSALFGFFRFKSPFKPLLSIGCVALLTTLLSACATPSQMIFNPAQHYALPTIYSGQTYSLKVDDQRANQHLLKVIDTDGKKQRYPATTAVASKLKGALQNGLQIQGINIADNNFSNNNQTITLSVHQLETIVEQNRFDYHAAFVVEFKVAVTKGSRTFTKIFTGNANNSGSLSFDQARMEQELNQLVT
ncbi:MAG: putative lipoprotein, partial [Phenylobacterium sp.]